MKGFKVVLAAAVVVMLAATLGFTQGRGDRQGRMNAGQGMGMRGAQMGGELIRVQEVLNQLDLTDEQKDRIEKIRGDVEKRMRETQEKMRGQMEALRKFREENPNDQEGLRQKRDEMMQAAAPMREAMQGAIEEIKGVLNEEQLKKFDELMQQRGGMQRPGQGGFPGIMPQDLDQLQLTPEQQEKLKGLEQTFTEEQKQLVEKYQNLLKALLTPEQQEKFEKAIADMKARMQNGMFGGRMMGRQRGNRGGGGAPPAPGGGDQEKPPAE